MQTFLELPPEIKNLILVGVTLLVGFVFAKIAESLPFLKDWLGQNATTVSVAVAGFLVNLLQGYLNQVPESWTSVATIGLQLLVAVLATLKVFDVLKNRKVKYFKTL